MSKAFIRNNTILVWLTLLIVTAQAATDRETGARMRPVIDIGRLPRAPRLEEFLDMRAPDEFVEHLTRIDNFMQERPAQGAKSSQRTEAYLGYDVHHLYAIFLAFDTEPGRIRAHFARRETVKTDDSVQLQIDTFDDEQRAYSFLVNPLGVQTDAIYTEGGVTGLTDNTWDAVWYSQGQITAEGYVVLITIPFRSLRFEPTHGQTWGVILTREIKRRNEIASWPAVDNNVQGRLNQAARMQGLEDISPSRNLQLISSATARRFKVLDESRAAFTRESFEHDAGVDVKWVLQDRLTLDLTANPEFGQVESDLPQLTANERFELYYPEKRPFFLDNAGYFSTPLDLNTENRLLFSRRIAQPRGGARLTGKLGKFSLGSLLIDDEAPGLRLSADDPAHGKRAQLGVLRVNREFADQSTVGLLYADYTFADSFNRVGGIDGRYRFGDHWNTSLQAVWSQTRTLTGERHSDTISNFELNRTGRGYQAHYHYMDVGRHFDTAAGFVPRVDQKNFHMRHTWTFWPEGERLVSWGPQVAMFFIDDQRDRRLDREIPLSMIWNFSGPAAFTVTYQDGSNRLYPEEFPVLTGSRRFDLDSVTVQPTFQVLDALEIQGTWTTGDAINFFPAVGEPSPAKEMTMTLAITWQPTSRFRIGATGSHRDLKDHVSNEQILRNHVAQLRFDYQLTARMSLRAILQQDWIDSRNDWTSIESDQRYNGDALFTYQANLWTALYVGYNTNYRNLEIVRDRLGATLYRTDQRYLNDSHQVFVKFSYLFHP